VSVFNDNGSRIDGIHARARHEADTQQHGNNRPRRPTRFSGQHSSSPADHLDFIRAPHVGCDVPTNPNVKRPKDFAKKEPGERKERKEKNEQ
jgi:hypothetical protein